MTMIVIIGTATIPWWFWLIVVGALLSIFCLWLPEITSIIKKNDKTKLQKQVSVATGETLNVNKHVINNVTNNKEAEKKKEIEESDKDAAALLAINSATIMMHNWYAFHYVRLSHK